MSRLENRNTPSEFLGRPFKNEPFTDFRAEENTRKMLAAVNKVQGDLGCEYDMILGGRRLKTVEKIISINPAKPSQVVGLHQRAKREHVQLAVDAALESFKGWSRTAVPERAHLLLRVAELLRRRKLEFCAWLVAEVSKNWAEADGEVAEAIDFCEYYAREAYRLGGVETAVQVPGEHDQLLYLPLGVAVVIPPWNFPLAIMAGMTLASLVCGNSVILKPSSEAPTIAAKFVELLAEAGIPDGIVSFCPGEGASFGNAVVAHAKTRFIAFTGSREVGLEISKRAAEQAEGQIWLKRTILEMGGKDAILVDSEADLERAVEGVTQSAFGFQGQKCSACSRAIVDESIYPEFLARLSARVSQLTIGDPVNNGDLGAVISASAVKSILDYIEVGKRDGRLISGGSRAESVGDGYFIEPTVIADVPPLSRLEQEEVFGPVLAVIEAKGFDHALAIANDTHFGLTGAIYTSSRAKIDRAIREFHVGNLYINRKCTGAIVGAHPFGGFNMSGTDSKAGGPDYLNLFCQAKSVGEKVI